MKKCLVAGLAVLVGFQSSVLGAAMSDVHRRLNYPEMSQREVISKFSLVRLWAFDQSRGFQEDLILSQKYGARQTSPLINRSYNVFPRSCGGKTFVYFDNGMISSDESLVIQNILQESKLTSGEETRFKIGKGWDLLERQFPNYVPKRNGMLSGSEERLQQNLKNSFLRDELSQSTSLVEVKDDPSSGKSYVNSVDYTVGGWFKSRNHEEGQQMMPLITKKLKNSLGEELIEWSVFTWGDKIFFHNFRDELRSSTRKFLTREEAASFRSQHADFYGAKEYYEDVLARPVLGEINTSVAKGSESHDVVALNRSFAAPPIVPSGKKPVLPPHQPVPVMPLPPPVYQPPVAVIPRPPGMIPVPIVYPVPVVAGQGKEYTLNFDMKAFWHGSTLGSCFMCRGEMVNGHLQIPETRQDAWYYFSVSVHQNDPLGPYVDLMMIRDAQPEIFGNLASIERNVKTARIELDRTILSRHAHNPFESTRKLERACEGEISCVNSVLEIGGLGTERGYRGFMRGVYIAKKSLKKSEMLEMASQFYPADSSQCTYTHLQKAN